MLDKMTAALSGGPQLSVSNEQLPEFKTEMTRASFEKEPMPRMQTIWGMKVELALRTSLAAALAAVYATHPEVHAAEWDHATVFAPVLAIACVSGPNLGATLHHAWQMWTATVIGCFSSMVVNEVFRPVRPAKLREGVMCVAFLLTVFFLSSRPWALVQKRVSVGVMLCGTIPMSVSGHTKEWWFPWTTGTPCTVGLVAAVIAMIFPYPRLAYHELRSRLAYQAMMEVQVLRSQYHAVASRSRAQSTHAAHLLEGFRDNLTAMRGLLSAIKHEFFLAPHRSAELKNVVTFFEGQLAGLRSLQLTSKSSAGTTSETHVKFQKITDSGWRMSVKSVTAAVQEVVTAERHRRPCDDSHMLALETAREKLKDDVAHARTEVLYPQGSLYNADEHNSDHFVEHIKRMATYFALDDLISACERMSMPAKPAAPLCRQRLRTLLRGCKSWLAPPSMASAREAFKKMLSLALLAIFSWPAEFRAGRPEYMWGFIAACFVFSDYEGSSISTGVGRIVGTLFGGMVGLISMDFMSLLHLGNHDAGGLAAHVLICVTWTFCCSLTRSSARHGYTATVAGFSIYIMVVGQLESFGQKSAHDVVLHRIREQFIGASVYITVEMLLWRRSAREKVNDEQLSILKAIQSGFQKGVQPYVAYVEKKELTSVPQADVAKAERAGNAALEAAKGGLVAASSEPSLWQKPFPTSQYQRLLHSEEKALRLTHTLAAATRSAVIDEQTADIANLVVNYANAANKALAAVIQKLEEWEAKESSVLGCCRFSIEPENFAESPDLEAAPEADVIAAALALFELHEAQGDLQKRATLYFERFVATHLPGSNTSALCVNATLFCLLNFSTTMMELGERLRVVQATEKTVN